MTTPVHHNNPQFNDGAISKQLSLKWNIQLLPSQDYAQSVESWAMLVRAPCLLWSQALLFPSFMELPVTCWNRMPTTDWNWLLVLPPLYSLLELVGPFLPGLRSRFLWYCLCLVVYRPLTTPVSTTSSTQSSEMSHNHFIVYKNVYIHIPAVFTNLCHYCHQADPTWAATNVASNICNQSRKAFHRFGPLLLTAIECSLVLTAIDCSLLLIAIECQIIDVVYSR